jgi:hypothetical protein
MNNIAQTKNRVFTYIGDHPFAVRIIFVVIIVMINILVITKPIQVLSNYDIDIDILISLILIVFLEPFIAIFDPYRVAIIKESESELVITDKHGGNKVIEYSISYSGKGNINVKLDTNLRGSISCEVEGQGEKSINKVFFTLSNNNPCAKIKLYCPCTIDKKTDRTYVYFLINRKIKKKVTL